MSGKKCIKYTEHFSPDAHRAFVIIPFREEFFDIYEFGILPCLGRNGIEAVNGRESYFLSGEYVICNICEEIIKAGLVVADLSENNANVYYEFGLAFALRRRCIVLHQESASFSTRIKNLINNSPGCTSIEYKSIKDIKDELPESVMNVQSARIPERAFKPVSDLHHVMAIVGQRAIVAQGKDEPTEQIVNPDDLFRYGIEESMKSVNARLPSSLTDLNAQVVENIAMSRDKFDKLVRKLMTCRFCIIDVNKSSVEAFFWMGFIHGLGINLLVDMRPDLSFLYISNDPDMTKLPFDIQAVKVQHYKSVKNASKLITDEIVRREIEKLRRKNSERHIFWKRMNFTNTKFLIGAADVYLAKETRYRSKVSLQDFKAFDMITYLFMLEQKQPFEYDRHFVRVSDYLGKSKNRQLADTTAISELKIETKPDDLFEVVRKGSDDSPVTLGDEAPPDVGPKKYVVLIGSNCVNPATQMMFELLYDREKHYEFRTTKPYKARGLAWKHIANPNDESVGIFLEEGTIQDSNTKGFSQYAKSGFRKDVVTHDKDAGLLIITNCWPKKDEFKPNRTIAFCGFRKYGTYLMAYILAHYARSSQTGELAAHCGCRLEIRGYKHKYIYDSDFLSLLNRKIEEFSHREYCLEAIFEFYRMDYDSREHEQWNARITGIFEFDTKKRTRVSIMNELVQIAENNNKDSEDMSGRVDSLNLQTKSESQNIPLQDITSTSRSQSHSVETLK